MMFITSQELYKAIKTEYDNSKEKKYSGKAYDAKTLKDTFAYKYFKRWKRQAADKYIGDREWVDKHIKSSNFAKSYSQKTCPDKYGMVYAAYTLFKEKRIDIDQCKRVFIYIAERKKNSNAKLIQKIKNGDEKDIKEAYEKLSYNLLCKAIGDHFKKEFDNGSLDEINMLHEFNRYIKRRETDNAADDDILSNEYINKCQELFELLLADGSGEADTAFIPLYFDEFSGAGVCILGKAYLNPDKENLKNCGVYTVRFDGIPIKNDDDDFDWAENGINLPFDYILQRFESVTDAYSDVLANGSDDNYYGYQNYNSNYFYPLVEEKFGGSFLRCFDTLQKRKEERMYSVIEEKRLEKEECAPYYDE